MRTQPCELQLGLISLASEQAKEERERLRFMTAYKYLKGENMLIKVPEGKRPTVPKYARDGGVSLNEADYNTLTSSIQALQAKHDSLENLVVDYINSTKALQQASQAPEFVSADQLLRDAIMSVLQSGSMLNKMLLEQKRDIIEMSMSLELVSAPAGGYA